MKYRRLGRDGLEVSAIGLGCMGMTYAYGGADEADSIRAIHRALDLGVTLLDTAELYGPFTNETLLGKALRGRRDQAVVATKFGFTFTAGGQISGADSRPEHIRQVADASLKRLGMDHIDLFYQHRVDPAVPIEDTVGAMADLVKAGKIRHLGLSEAGAATLRRAASVHPIGALQSEYSLWTRDVEAEILPTCRELGIGFVPYSPLGRGFLTGKFSEASFAPGDFRRGLPRFRDEAFARNMALVDRLKTMAEARDCTLAQLALAWLLNQGEDIVPIPGARKIAHLEDNAGAADIVLSPDELTAIAAALPASEVAGARYNPDQLAMVGR